MTNYAAVLSNSKEDKNEIDWENSIDWLQIPRTVNDAIELTKRIGERYIWVDSLCIDQFDAEDKGFLISQMGSIFANAHLTIVAADGSDAGAGLHRLHSQQVDGITECPLDFNAAGGPIALLRRKAGHREAIIHSHWSKRGWTLQERLLSKRCVFFTHEQVYFQDAEIQVSEAYDIHRPEATTALKKHAQNNESFDVVGELYFRMLEKNGLNLGQYDQLIKEYTKRHLTHAGDRFDAFMGISEFFQPPGLPLEHVWALNALPLKYFTNALRWQHDSWRKTPPKRIRIDARDSRCLPSWSWVGWDGEVSGPFHFDPFANAARIVDSANIVCEVRRAPPWFCLELCEPSEPAQSTLHLYTESTPCRLDAHQDREFSIKYGSTFDRQLKDTVKLDEAPQSHWKFELARMSRSEYWLVRVDQPFAERLAFVDVYKDEGLRGCSREKYLRVR